MAIMDKNLLFSSAQAVTATAASTDVIDLGAQMDYGIGDNPALKLLALVITAFSTTNSGTLTVAFQGSTDNVTFDTYAQTIALTAGALTAGARLFDIDVPRPSSGQSRPRYLRLNYTVANNFTAGTVTAGLLLDRGDRIAYPPGIGISN